jgi:glyoxylase-like metal-dependent hydrolase (beta-lactamase superfamily II)
LTRAPLDRPARADRFAVYALHYASRMGARSEHFPDGSAEPHLTAYYAWLAVSATRTVLIDCGIHPDAAPPVTGWRWRRAVPDLLAELLIVPDTIVLTHLHYDHVGGLRLLPDTDVVLQEAEWRHWSGLGARERSRLVSAADLECVRRLLTGGRVRLVSGDAEIAPGLSVHHVDGHTAGMQIVRVATLGPTVVVASDVSHFYENLGAGRVGTILHDRAAALAAFDRVRRLAGAGIILPGHDPLVASQFAGSPDDIIVRIV